VADTTPLEKVLALRPTNVVSRFGQLSRMPVLNPRDVSAALDATGAGLASFPAYAPQAIPGILRASRDEDAPVGLTCPWPLPGREGPRRFVETVRAVGEEVRHRKPLFLQAGPVKLSPSLDAEAIHLLIEAGFTSVSLDARDLGPEAVEAYRRAAQPLAERELSVEIAAPLDGNGKLSPVALRAVLEKLAARGALVQCVRAPVQAFAAEEFPREPWQQDLSTLARSAEVARAHGAVLAVEDSGLASSSLGRAWVEAGARRAEPMELMARVVAGTLNGARMAWDGEVDQRAALRIEALTWAAACDFLSAMRARGTSSRVVMFLARGGRY
jgi:hypothetical protein